MEEWKRITKYKDAFENLESQVLILQEKLQILMTSHKYDKKNLEMENEELKEELQQTKEALKQHS